MKLTTFFLDDELIMSEFDSICIRTKFKIIYIY